MFGAHIIAVLAYTLTVIQAADKSRTLRLCKSACASATVTSVKIVLFAIEVDPVISVYIHTIIACPVSNPSGRRILHETVRDIYLLFFFKRDAVTVVPICFSAVQVEAMITIEALQSHSHANLTVIVAL
eukprot:SAG31_NODE_10744_length_1103_cov_1.449203_2_plen_129_part_00